MPNPFREFTVRHDDFHIDGLFCIVELLDIEFSTDIHGAFQIEHVRRVQEDDALVSVPVFISDYIASWARTPDGKDVIQKAYDESEPHLPLYGEEHPDNAAPLWLAWRAA